MTDNPELPPSAAPSADSPPRRHEAVPDTIADGREKSLDRAWISVQRITGAITASVLSVLILIASISLVASLSPSFVVGLLVVGGWGALTLAFGLLAFFWPPVRYRHTRYRLDDRGIQIRRGVWWKSTVNVPHSRVQHTDVQQGPVERGFGLATLIVHTAGTQHASIPLSGLAHEVALEIRDYLLSEEGDPSVGS